MRYGATGRGWSRQPRGRSRWLLLSDGALTPYRHCSTPHQEGQERPALIRDGARYLDLSPESTPRPQAFAEYTGHIAKARGIDKDHFECSTPPSASPAPAAWAPCACPAGARQGRRHGAWIFDMKAEGEPPPPRW